jgi:GR25 family glycosyltransferase involved in LPS biosynthesis
MYSVVINLEKDKKRLEDFYKSYKELDLEDIFGKINRFDAIDGFKTELPDYWLVPNALDKKIYKEGTYGCFLSHYTVLNNFLDSSYEILTIFEDDAGFVKTFTEEFNNFYKNVPDDWEMLYLSYSIVRHFGQPKQINEFCYKTMSSNLTTCYMVNKIGAKNVLDFLNENIKKKNNKPIDCQLCLWHRFRNIYQPRMKIVKPNHNAKISNIYK